MSPRPPSPCPMAVGTAQRFNQRIYMTNYITNHEHVEDVTRKHEDKIEHYIAKIAPIRKSNRNTALHKLALCLRSKFGLTGDALEARLQEVNQAKCAPPLSKSEVKAICRSADKSEKVTLGKPGTHRNRPRVSTPKYQTVNVISVSDISIPVANLLQKDVSTYDNCRVNVPSGTFTIGAMLESFKTDK